MKISLVVGSLAVAVCALGCDNADVNESASSDDALSSNVNSAVHAARFAAVAQSLPAMARKAARDFASETKTTPLTKLVSATCSGKKEILGASPAIWWKGCDLVFQNGTGTTTFSTSLTGEAVVKGGPDLDKEPDAHGKFPVAKRTRVSISLDTLKVSSGVIPAINPIAISDGAAVDAYVKTLLGGDDPSVRGGGQFSTDGCDGLIEPSEVPSSSRLYCYNYSGDDGWNGSVMIMFEASGDELVGVRYMSSDSGF